MYRITLAVGSVLASLALAACSSDNSSPSASRPAGPTGHAVSQAGVPAVSATPGAGSVSQFCSLVGESNQLMGDIAAGDAQPGGVDATKFKNDLDAALAAAPDEIKADMKVIVAFDEAIMTNHSDAPETPALGTAMQHYATWIGAHCAGAALQPGGTS